MGGAARDIYGSGYVEDAAHGSAIAPENTNDSLAYEEV